MNHAFNDQVAEFKKVTRKMQSTFEIDSRLRDVITAGVLSFPAAVKALDIIAPVMHYLTAMKEGFSNIDRFRGKKSQLTFQF